MSVIDEVPAAQEAPERPSLPRRVLNAYLDGNPFVITTLAFLAALVVGAFFIMLADPPTRQAFGYFTSDPSDTFTRGWSAISAAYSALFKGAIFNPDSLYSNGGVPVFKPITATLFNAAPLILGGLSVSVAFRAGLFNIGGQGQIIAGAILAGYVGFAWPLPAGLHVLVAVLAGILGGAIWGGLVGWLKAKTGAHEVITTIMLNYVALYLLYYLLSVNGFQTHRQPPGDLAPDPQQRPAAVPVRCEPAGQPRSDHRLAGRRGLLVAAESLDAGFPAARGRRQPARRPYRGHEHLQQLHHGDGDRRGVDGPGRGPADPRRQQPCTDR